MKKPKITFLGIIILFIAVIGLLGSDEKLPKIYVAHTGDDSIGARVASAVRDKIAASPRYLYVNNPKNCTLQISIVSVPIDGEKYSSTMAVTFVFYPNTVSYYAYSFVLIVGLKRVDIQASSMVAAIDKIIEDYWDIAFYVYYSYREFNKESEIKK